MPVEQELFSIDAVATMTGLSAAHVRRAVKGGTLVSSNMGTPDRALYRISRENVHRWVKEREAGAKPPPGRVGINRRKPEKAPPPPCRHFG
jgi:excisionase family DNA binding protein